MKRAGSRDLSEDAAQSPAGRFSVRFDPAMIARMQEWLDWLHFLWFREVRGSPLWGWLVLGAFLAFIAGTLIAVFFFGWVMPNRCNPNGECWGPW